MKERQSRSSEEMKPLREMKFSTRASTKYTLAGVNASSSLKILLSNFYHCEIRMLLAISMHQILSLVS